MTTWAEQIPCSPKALSVDASVHGPGQHVYPTMPKLTLPGASFSSSISQQEPKTHSCSPVFACLSSPLCRGRTTRVGVARMALIHEWQRGQNEREKKKNQTGAVGPIPLETQMCVAIILLHGQNGKIKPAVGNYFASAYSKRTEHWPKPLGVDRLVAIDLLSYWSVCLIWPVGLSSHHCYSRKLPLWDLFVKMRSGRRAGDSAHHITSAVMLVSTFNTTSTELLAGKRRSRKRHFFQFSTDTLQYDVWDLSPCNRWDPKCWCWCCSVGSKINK